MRTKFVSQGHGCWQIEVNSSTHAGTLIEATAKNKADSIPSIDPLARTAAKELKTAGDELREQRRIIQEGKADLAQVKFTQIHKLAEIVNMKRRYATVLAD